MPIARASGMVKRLAARAKGTPKSCSAPRAGRLAGWLPLPKGRSKQVAGDPARNRHVDSSMPLDQALGIDDRERDDVAVVVIANIVALGSAAGVGRQARWSDAEIQ